jgi:hypothetical protein
MAALANRVRSLEIAERIGDLNRRQRRRVSVSPRVISESVVIEHRASDICCQESSVSG